MTGNYKIDNKGTTEQYDNIIVDEDGITIMTPDRGSQYIINIDNGGTVTSTLKT